MTQTSTAASPPPPQHSSQPLPLHYAQAQPRASLLDPAHPALVVVGRLLFSLGVGLVGFGVVGAWAGVEVRDAPYAAGWGAGLIALTAPVWRRRRAD